LALTTQPPTSEVKKRVELYLHSLSLPSRKVIRKNLPCNIAMMIVTGKTYNKNCNNNSYKDYHDEYSGSSNSNNNNNNNNMSQKTAKFLQKLQLHCFIS
jgi:hypothetical protein